MPVGYGPLGEKIQKQLRQRVGVRRRNTANFLPDNSPTRKDLPSHRKSVRRRPFLDAIRYESHCEHGLKICCKSAGNRSPI